MKKSKIFLNGILLENPLFMMVLGVCPALAVTKTVENALGMGILFTFVLVCSNVLISLLRKLIPDEIRIPSYILVIATFVTVVKMLSEAFLPELYSSLGVFVSLLVVNCIVLGRAEAFASKNGPLDSLLDGLGNGIGYTLAIVIIALIREVLGAGSLTIGATFTFINNGNPLRLYLLKGPSWDYSIFLFQTSAGGFLTLGIVLAVITLISNVKKEKRKALSAKAKKEGNL